MNLETKVTKKMTIEEVAAAVLKFSIYSEVSTEREIVDWLVNMGVFVRKTIEELVDELHYEWEVEEDEEDEEDEESEESGESGGGWRY